MELLSCSCFSWLLVEIDQATNFGPSFFAPHLALSALSMPGTANQEPHSVLSYPWGSRARTVRPGMREAKLRRENAKSRRSPFFSPFALALVFFFPLDQAQQKKQPKKRLCPLRSVPDSSSRSRGRCVPRPWKSLLDGKQSSLTGTRRIYLFSISGRATAKRRRPLLRFFFSRSRPLLSRARLPLPLLLSPSFSLIRERRESSPLPRRSLPLSSFCLFLRASRSRADLQWGDCGSGTAKKRPVSGGTR